jgi:hypothetical protein
VKEQLTPRRDLVQASDREALCEAAPCTAAIAFASGCTAGESLGSATPLPFAMPPSPPDKQPVHALIPCQRVVPLRRSIHGTVYWRLAVQSMIMIGLNVWPREQTGHHMRLMKVHVCQRFRGDVKGEEIFCNVDNRNANRQT